LFRTLELPFHNLISFVATSAEIEHKDKDLVFINYTFKRFEGLTQRGGLSKIAAGMAAASALS